MSAPLDVDGDGCSELSVPNVTMEIFLRPVQHGVGMEGREVVDGLGLSIQAPLLYLDRSDGVGGLLLRPQIGDLPRQDVSGHGAISDFISNLAEAPIESTISTDSDIAHSCVASVLVVNSGVLSKNVAVGDAKDLVAAFAVLAEILMEPKSESALGVSLVQVLGGEWNAVKRGEEAANIVSSIRAVNSGQEGGTCQPLENRLPPLYHNTLDAIEPQEGKNLLGDLVGRFGRGSTGFDPDPNDDRTKTPLPSFFRRVSEEPSRVDGCQADFSSLDDVHNMEADSDPDLALVERCVEDSAERFDGERGESASRFGEGCGAEVRPVDENRMVVVTRDSIVIGSTFEGAGTDVGESSSFAGDGEAGDTGRHGPVAKGRGAREASQGLEIDALEGMDGELWTEGGKCGIFICGARRPTE